MKGSSMVKSAAAQGAVANFVGVNSVSRLTATAHISLALRINSSWVATKFTGTGVIGTGLTNDELMGSIPTTASATSMT
ncbi:MAG: hypothetical protein EBT76_04320 [Microbacteriaceae bacterium]|nr:hypothetical protein [Microbacteriaceae bacterium]